MSPVRWLLQNIKITLSDVEFFPRNLTPLFSLVDSSTIRASDTWAYSYSSLHDIYQQLTATKPVVFEGLEGVCLALQEEEATTSSI